MREISELIKEFISQILAKYPDIYVGYSYDEELDDYEIWHDNQELEFYDKEFTEYIGEKADELLFKNNIYNFSFGYNYFKAKELKCKTKIYDKVASQGVKYEFVQRDNEYKQSNYKENFNIHVSHHLNIEFGKSDNIDLGEEVEYRVTPSSDMGPTLYKMDFMEVA